jgi:hypothetical protein
MKYNVTFVQDITASVTIEVEVGDRESAFEKARARLAGCKWCIGDVTDDDYDGVYIEEGN